MKYHGIIKQRELWLTITIFIIAAYLLYREYAAGQYIYIPLALMVMLACFFEREHIISEEGVDIKYNLFKVCIKHNYWAWDEITTLHPDYKRARPNVMLHIGKDVVTRTFTMKPSDCKGAMELARRMNPHFYIDDITETEQELREQQILHRQEVAKAQKAAAKRRKK